MKVRLKSCLFHRRTPLILVVLFLLCLWIVTELDKYFPVKDQLQSIIPDMMVQMINEKFKDQELLNLKDKRYGMTCNEEAAKVGYHQKVISYSYYKNDRNPKADGYWVGLNETMQVIAALYPGWHVRIYATSEDISFLHTKVSNYPYLFFCDVYHLPPPLLTLEHHPATIWRFAPMGDPQVDIVIFRDTDSQILPRELEAVNEWLFRTKKTLHIMRDNKSHTMPILAGMWGLRITDKNRMRIRDMRDKIYSMTYNYVRFKVDQPILKTVVMDTLKDDVIAHDSYYCTTYEGSLPWPTKRSSNLYFVGSAYFRNYTAKRVYVPCPAACRPRNHQDWIYC